MDDRYYETIITKLCEILSIMDTKEVMAEIDENSKLKDLYCTINDTTNRFEKLQRITKNPRYIPLTNNFSNKTIIHKDVINMPEYCIIDTQTNTFLKAKEVCEILNNYEKIIFQKLQMEEDDTNGRLTTRNNLMQGNQI